MNKIQKFLCVFDGHHKTDFSFNKELRTKSAPKKPKNVDPFFFLDNMVGVPPPIRNMQELAPTTPTFRPTGGVNPPKVAKTANFEKPKSGLPA